jgi:hypothetical protein
LLVRAGEVDVAVGYSVRSSDVPRRGRTLEKRRGEERRLREKRRVEGEELVEKEV